jgi:ABC-type phosphate transport system permease subunit
MSRGTAERVVPTPLVAASHQRRFVLGDRIFRTIAYAAALLIMVIAVIFLIALVIPALPAITRFGLGFFVTAARPTVVSDRAAGRHPQRRHRAMGLLHADSVDA